MAEFTHIDLRLARESHKIPRWELAAALGVSEETIKRWEYGTQRPEPDDVGNIERVLKMPGLWHKWMISNHESYRERYSEIPDIGHLTAGIARAKYEISDVVSLIGGIERDSLDGKIDDVEAAKKLKREAREAVAAILQMIDLMPE